MLDQGTTVHVKTSLYSPRPPITLCCGHASIPRQLAIESRVTSDELQQAVGANADRITALQSSVDTALNDRFRRVQDMVQAQVNGTASFRSL